MREFFGGGPHALQTRLILELWRHADLRGVISPKPVSGYGTCSETYENASVRVTVKPLLWGLCSATDDCQ